VTRNLSHVSATLLLMTSSSPVHAPVTRPPARGDLTPPGELGPNFRAGSIWFLAGCDRCSTDTAEPFQNQTKRDGWAVDHLTSTGHVVRISVDGVPDSAHLTAYLRRTDDGAGFKWLCPGDARPAWIGNYETVQLALADWRSHSGVSVR
jgi:hypothetical protein